MSHLAPSQINPYTYEPSVPALSISSILFFYTSVAIYNLFNSYAYFLPMTYLMAVKKDYGLKNLEIIITLGNSIGDS